MSFNVDELIAKLQDKGNVTINIINVSSDDTIPDDDFDVVDDTPVSDFAVGDRVLVCHTKKNGETIHPDGTVSSIGTDDKGDYVRVDGDNGKHYKCGLHLNEARLGSKIVRVY